MPAPRVPAHQCQRDEGGGVTPGFCAAFPLTGVDGRKAETRDQHPVENGDNGDKLRKELFDTFVPPFTW